MASVCANPDSGSTSGRSSSASIETRTAVAAGSTWKYAASHDHSTSPMLRPRASIGSATTPASSRADRTASALVSRRDGVPLRYAGGIVPAGLEKLYYIGLADEMADTERLLDAFVRARTNA